MKGGSATAVFHLWYVGTSSKATIDFWLERPLNSGPLVCTPDAQLGGAWNAWVVTLVGDPYDELGLFRLYLSPVSTTVPYPILGAGASGPIVSCTWTLPIVDAVGDWPFYFHQAVVWDRYNVDTGADVATDLLSYHVSACQIVPPKQADTSMTNVWPALLLFALRRMRREKVKEK